MDLIQWQVQEAPLLKIGTHKVIPYRYINRAYALYNMGFPQKAEAEALEALRIEPYNAKAHKLLGKIYNERGEYARGFESLRKAKLWTPTTRKCVTRSPCRFIIWGNFSRPKSMPEGLSHKPDDPERARPVVADLTRHQRRINKYKGEEKACTDHFWKRVRSCDWAFSHRPRYLRCLLSARISRSRTWTCGCILPWAGSSRFIVFPERRCAFLLDRGPPWINHEWLFQVIVYNIFNLWGAQRLIMMQVVIVGLTMMLLLCLGYDKNRQLLTAVILFLALHDLSAAFYDPS